MSIPLPIISRSGLATSEQMLGTDQAADWMAGNGGDDTLYGYAGDDRLNGNVGNDKLYGGLGDDRMMGGAGHDELYGEQGNDRLSGDQGNDRMTGGEGLDTFTFINKFGLDTITDFVAADDTIQFVRKSFTSFAQVQAAWSQDGDDVVIRSGTANVLRIENVSLDSLTQADFLFV